MSINISNGSLRKIVGTMVFIISLVCSICAIYAAEIENDENDNPQIMVSMGDSYSAGEGIEDFYGQEKSISEKVDDDDWIAHRSRKSWPGRLKLESNGQSMEELKDNQWFFVAASGATTENIKYIFTKEYKKKIRQRVHNADYVNGEHILSPQIEVFNRTNADYVTLTLGGNDAGFADILKSCAEIPYIIDKNALIKKLDDVEKRFKADGGIRDKLKNTYKLISEKAGSKTKIIVAGYPQLFFTEEKFTPPFTIENKKTVNKRVTWFNNELNSIVDECRKEDGMDIYFVSVETPFKTKEAEVSRPCINGIIFHQPEDLLDSNIISDYSFHPTDLGAGVYAQEVQKQIEDIKNGIDDSLSENSVGSEIEDEPVASTEEMNAKPIGYGGYVLRPEDVVLKFYHAIPYADFKTAVECLEPEKESQLRVLAGAATAVVDFFGGDYIPWGQVLYETAGVTEVAIIDCYADNMVFDSGSDILNYFIPKTPGLNDAFCKEADVHMKTRYKYKDQYHVYEEGYHVKNYYGIGWRMVDELPKSN